jgi:uroporphyrin-III C-methyltransferase
MQHYKSKGRLVIAGCGLHPGHMTLETVSQISHADHVVVVAPNPLSVQHIRSLNASVENLGRFYGNDRTRMQTYRLMAHRMVELVEQGKNICAVFYGHPGIFVLSTHLASNLLKQAGYPVSMLPGISADACLFTDLDIDPASSGCQSYEATQFLLTRRTIDTGAALILWQIGLVGEHTLKSHSPGEKGLFAISQLLLEHYSPAHQICLYEAPTLPGFAPRKDWISLSQLASSDVQPITTLFIPAAVELDFATERLALLGLTEADLAAWDDCGRVEDTLEVSLSDVD